MEFIPPKDKVDLTLRTYYNSVPRSVISKWLSRTISGEFSFHTGVQLFHNHSKFCHLEIFLDDKCALILICQKQKIEI